MTEKDFTNRIDGLINDYEGGESTSKELRDGILDTLIELVSKVSPFEARVKPKIADILNELFEKYTEEKRNNYDDTEFYVGGLQDGKLVALAEIKERLSNFSV